MVGPPEKDCLPGRILVTGDELPLIGNLFEICGNPKLLFPLLPKQNPLLGVVQPDEIDPELATLGVEPYFRCPSGVIARNPLVDGIFGLGIDSGDRPGILDNRFALF